jgi:hypothetical protein
MVINFELNKDLMQFQIITQHCFTHYLYQTSVNFDFFKLF